MARTPDVQELVAQGVAIVIASRDDRLRPAVTRGWAPVLSPDGRTLTLCVDAPAGSPSATNIAPGRPLAVTMSRPSTYSTVQLKGLVSSVAGPSDADRARVAAHVEAFVDEVRASSLTPARARKIARDELVTVSLDVLERYDQTPGSGAGRSL